MFIVSTLIWLVAINVFRFVLPASRLCCAQEMPHSIWCSFMPPFLSRFQQNDFIFVTMTFRAPGTFYLLCLSAFLTWYSVVTNQIILLTIHFQTIYCVDDCFMLTVLLEELLPSWRPAPRKPLDPSFFSPFNLFISHLSCILCTALTTVVSRV